MSYHNGEKWVSCLFVQPRDTKKEIWEGRIIGVEKAASEWPVDEADSIENMSDSIKSRLSECNGVHYISNLNSVVDEIVLDSGNQNTDPRPILDKMRRIKSPKEIEFMLESAKIASSAHVEAMKVSHSGIGEWEIQSVIEGHFMNCKSQWSYPSIVGGGENGTILHYNTNKSVVNDGELVLVDAGCEVHGYASDVTRTWPVNGKFTDPQREIYELVLKAELAGIEACQKGSSWLSIHTAASQVLAAGLIKLGILDCSIDDAIGDPEKFDGPYRNFFMHGTGHFLGLDVHDVGGGRQGDDDKGPVLEPGMVLTVEPGLYFGGWRTDVKIPERYSKIGIRIEDDILITEEGPVVLTSDCPKTIEEIEALVGSGV
jgi:Xaa-Pro aminopeptidase